MTNNLLIEVAPPMWELEPGDVLRLGSKRIHLHDVIACQAEEVVERDLAGLVIVALLFMAGALVFLTGVGEFGWRARFLIATGFLGALGFSAVSELFQSKPIHFARVTVQTGSGEEVLFTTPRVADAADIKALVDAYAPDASPS